jgi:hypothetical protein
LAELGEPDEDKPPELTPENFRYADGDGNLRRFSIRLARRLGRNGIARVAWVKPELLPMPRPLSPGMLLDERLRFPDPRTRRRMVGGSRR